MKFAKTVISLFLPLTLVIFPTLHAATVHCQNGTSAADCCCTKKVEEVKPCCESKSNENVTIENECDKQESRSIVKSCNCHFTGTETKTDQVLNLTAQKFSANKDVQTISKSATNSFHSSNKFPNLNSKGHGISVTCIYIMNSVFLI